MRHGPRFPVVNGYDVHELRRVTARGNSDHDAQQDRRGQGEKGPEGIAKEYRGRALSPAVR